MIARRTLLRSFLAAPAIVAASSLMPVRLFTIAPVFPINQTGAFADLLWPGLADLWKHDVIAWDIMWDDARPARTR